MTRNRVLRWIVLGSWALLGGGLAWLAAFSGIDPGSAILFALALPAIAGAVLCVARAIDTPDLGGRLVWAGRALGLLGAAIAVSFPAALYQEIAMLVGQGRALTYDIERAIWYESASVPLVVVPAVLALRWPRLGGVLFAFDGMVNVGLSVLRPFGVIYPEATASGFIGIPIFDLTLQPAFITAAMLLIGSARRSMEQRTTGLTGPSSALAIGGQGGNRTPTARGG